MRIEIKNIRKEDDKQAIQFAITGMHFGLYLENRFLLNIYGRYFWYNELNHATQAIAAYAGDTFAGVLLADMKEEKKKYQSFGKTVYIKLFEFLQSLFPKGGADVYEETNREMWNDYKKSHDPNGQIVFLAANPAMKGNHIGSRLLEELEHREKGKQVYLYTDDACSYQFYDHRGFERLGEKDVVLDFGGGKVPLKCMLYSKVL